MKQLLQKFLAIKTLIYIIIFGILGYGIFVKTRYPIIPSNTSMYQSGMNSVCFDNQCFDSEIADSEQEREQGLMNRTLLPTQSGMLFVFPEEGKHSFWMKNTLIPLDMIWIDHQGRVVDIQTAQPCDSDPCPSYTPSHSGLYVLEVNAGISKLLGLQIGSIAHISKE